jgi:hypothetical protein
MPVKTAHPMSHGFMFQPKQKPRTVSDGGLCMVGRDRLELPTFCV